MRYRFDGTIGQAAGAVFLCSHGNCALGFSHGFDMKRRWLDLCKAMPMMWSLAPYIGPDCDKPITIWRRARMDIRLVCFFLTKSVCILFSVEEEIR